jgi:hypothetical protein
MQPVALLFRPKLIVRFVLRRLPCEAIGAGKKRDIRGACRRRRRPEQPHCQFGGHPFFRAGTDVDVMTGPLEVIWVGNDFGAYGIEMDVSNQLHEVTIVSDELCVISTLEKMPGGREFRLHRAREFR